jgi:hypothetical protein
MGQRHGLFTAFMLATAMAFAAGDLLAQGAGRGGGAAGAGGGGGGRGGGQPDFSTPRQIPNGVLSASSNPAPASCQRPSDCPNSKVPMTPLDSVIQQVVTRLDFTSYKELIRGLTQFGDRRAGTERGNQAIDWIEAQLRGWGYVTERLHYTVGGNDSTPPEPREQVYATKIGSTNPGEMVILGAHMDGIGNGEGANDNASGTALVMEIARVLAPADVQTDRSIRFALWNNEETGLNGARAYVQQRAELQGIENPAGSGRYPEPRWIAMIQHDKVLFDHGLPVQHQQVWDADVDVEFQMVSEKSAESAQLGLAMINANRKFATDYPAALSNSMSNTDSTPFMNLVPSVSVRENRRLYEIGWQGPQGWGARGSDPNWHQPTDLFVTYHDPDFRLGYNAMQTTLAATLTMVGVRLFVTLP